MKKILAFFCIISLGCLATDTGLLLRATFDGFTTIPDQAVDRRVLNEGISHELQLRMFPNIKGENGNALCLTNPEFVSYPIQNFTGDKGTVMIWFAPQNWSMIDSKHYQSFVEVRGNDYRFILYKPSEEENCACFYLQSGNRVYAVKGVTANWKKGEWHHLAAVWDSKEMKIYLDGKVGGKAQKRVFERPMEMPKALKHCSIWINQCRGWRHNPTWQTAYDDLEIFDRCLTSDEIAATVEKYFPADFTGAMKQPVLTIGRGNPITLDGVIDDAEWKDASSVPVVNQMNYGREKALPLIHSAIWLKYDSENLYAAIQVDQKPQRTGLTAHDSEVWTNDSFDIFLTGTDGNLRQFAVSASGGLYDSLNEDGKWNSHAKCATVIAEDKWTAELVIPLSDLGNPGKGNELKGNFGSTNYYPMPNYHTWSRVYGFGKGFSAAEFFGKVTFGTSGESVRYFGPGELGKARFSMRLEGNGGFIGSGKWTAHSGENSSPTQNCINRAWDGDLPAGQVILESEIKTPDGKSLLQLDILAEIKQALTGDFLCLPNKKKLYFTLDFSAAGKSVLGSTGKAQIVGIKDKKVYAEKSFSVKSPEIIIEFPFDGNLPANSDFNITAKLDNDPAMEITRKFRTADATELTPAECNHDVPAPWTPVQTSGNKVTLLDREYIFDRGPLPNRIITRGTDVIAKQPAFVFNNKEIAWQAVTIGKNYGDYVEITCQGQTDGMKLECHGELWFDGMYKFTTTFTPVAKDTQINSLHLTWKTPVEQSKYVMATIFRPWSGNSLDLEWNTNELYSSMWTSGIVTGLAWWCESDANWRNKPSAKNIHLRRNEQETQVTIDLITVPVTTEKSFAYTMVLQGTPARHPEKQWRNRNYGMTIPYSNVGIGWGSGNGECRPCDQRHYTSMIPLNAARFKEYFDYWANKRKIPCVLYAFPPHLSRFDREYDVHFREWATTPGIPWGNKDSETGERYFTLPCCSITDAGNLFVHRVEKLFQDYPTLYGIYYDISHVVSCDNAYHGHGGIDAFGKKFSTSNALSMRSYFLRIYKLHKKYNRYMMLHAHNKFFPFVHDFAELWAPGEEQFAAYCSKPFYYYMEEIPFEEYQSAWNSEIRGVAVHMIPQEHRACQLMQEMKKLEAQLLTPEAIIRSISPALLHDFKLWESMPRLKEKNPLSQVWKIKEPLKLEEATFHGYWFDSAVRSEDSKVFCSWYDWKNSPKAPYRRLLVVVNTARTPKAIALHIDWKKLGVEPANAKMTELWTNKTMQTADLKTLTLPGNHFALIAIE